MITQIDLQIMEWIQNHLQSEMMTFIMKFFTHVGDLMLLWAILLIIYFLFKKDKMRSKKIFFSLLLTFIISEIILKNIVKRPRPFVENKHLQSLIHDPTSYSFPSSHSATSFAVASSLTKIKPWVTIGSYVLAACIAFSRVYLNVHHPSDILIGALIGICASKFIDYVLKKIDLNKSKKSEEINL
ncbi:phosphatase PAP2 family protein [Anaerorhabdus furcosa]|uniref:Undecaprenyl-diphosphatase n=1 Tax=Anaerorhabdus furcosa TaxID=118967 RepID=A0A1T4PVS3_9FIRM|nr:phosphatase PAP2 family protein [Anaerorhabdus furcosa]SJZ95664.1 undecaprenyl-diphosphatase [Anaerorhabdus furcosa]